MLLTLTCVCFILALIPALLFLANLRLYAPPPASCPAAGGVRPHLSVLIPARNEEAAIGAAVRSALATMGAELEVPVLDDHADDRTAAIVEKLAKTDVRVPLLSAPELPA